MEGIDNSYGDSTISDVYLEKRNMEEVAVRRSYDSSGSSLETWKNLAMVTTIK
jgi:hypothetical protein